MTQRLIFLIGFMGAGKSTLGRKMAAQGRYDFIDLDDFITEIAGQSIPEIFAQKGETIFRGIETEALRRIAPLSNKDLVIACGGGAPCFGNNLAIMKSKGTVVYLKPGIEELTRRLLPEQAGRPLIRDIAPEHLQNHIYNMLNGREAFYMQADYILENPNPQAQDLEQILNIA